VVDQIGFYFISSSSRKLKAKEICPLVNELEKKGKRKKIGARYSPNVSLEKSLADFTTSH
jgi:hypothetical protein